MSIIQHSKSSPAGSQYGLSLIELMISITIGMILLLGISTLIAQQNTTRNELEKASRQIENGRYAMQLLRDDIQLAGYYGKYYDTSSLTVPGTLPDPCDTTVAGLAAAIPLPIQGYDASAAPLIASGCLNTNDYKSGTDILVVRRTSTIQNTGSFTVSTPAQIFMQATATSYVLSTVPSAFNASDTTYPAPFSLTTTTSATAPAAIQNYWVHIYFISPCDVPASGQTHCTSAADNGNPIPTLKMLDITSTTLPTSTPLVEGIENMQLDYGLDTTSDGYPDSYTTDPGTTTNWTNVMAIRVNLLARNTECTAHYTDNKTYNLGLAGSVTAPASTCANNGGYKRHVFSELVRAINPSGRRAQE